jgi:hypothetical protein
MSTNTSPGTARPFDPGDIPHALAQIARLAEGVKGELDLIAGRMTWLAISESFIFSAFATALAGYRPDHQLARGLMYLLWVMPLTGMFLAVCVYVAILAAHSALASLKAQRDRMIEGLPSQLRIDLISAQNRVQWWGNLPTHLIPVVFFFIWTGLLAMLLAGLYRTVHVH